MGLLISVVGLAAICICQISEIKELKQKLDIKTSENLSLKRVMYENNLIPKEYVK